MESVIEYFVVQACVWPSLNFHLWLLGKHCHSLEIRIGTLGVDSDNY